MKIPYELKNDYEVQYQGLVEHIADLDESLTQKYLENGKLSDSEIVEAIVFFVLMGSGCKEGYKRVLDPIRGIHIEKITTYKNKAQGKF